MDIKTILRRKKKKQDKPTQHKDCLKCKVDKACELLEQITEDAKVALAKVEDKSNVG